MIDYSKITMPQAKATKYSFTQPPNNIIFYNNHSNKQVEVLRITKEGITANPDVPTDEAASAVIRALDVYIKNLVQRTWVGLTEEEVKECFTITPDQFLPWHIYKRIEAKLKERNT